MFNTSDVSLDCRTCVAANTTACQDCVVQHLLANDAGPIEFVPVALSVAPNPVDRVVDLFAGAGLIETPVEFVEWGEFESARVHELTR